jgi:hypothetical protein
MEPSLLIKYFITTNNKLKNPPVDEGFHFINNYTYVLLTTCLRPQM